jgi:hypothetical protein
VDSIKMDFREIGWDGMDWIDLTQDRNQWRAFVRAVITSRFHNMLESSSVAAQEGLSFMSESRLHEEIFAGASRSGSQHELSVYGEQTIKKYLG